MATQGGGTTVPISFPTNTVDLSKAIDLLKSSRTATDQLRDSTKKLGTDTQAAGRQVSSTLEGMNLRLAQLKGQISLTSTTNTAQLNKLSAEYKSLQAEIDRTTKKLFEQQKVIKDNSKAVDDSSKSWLSFGATVRNVIAALLIREIVNLGLEMTKLAGQVEGVKRAFDKLPNSTLLMEQLKKATHGTVTELELMQNAIKFKNFNLPIQDLGKYLEFAAIRAQQTGESVDYMVNSIVTGLGRGSIKILDNLQINVNALKKDMADTGATIQEAFGRQVQIEMEKLGGYIETGATQAQRLDTNAKNLFATLSKKLEQSSFVRWLADNIEKVNNGLLSDDELIEKIASRESDRAIKAIENSNKAIVSEKAKTKAILDGINEEIKRRQDLQYEINTQAGQAQKNADNGAFAAFADSDEQKRINDMKERAKILGETITILKEYTTVLNENLNKKKEIEVDEEALAEAEKKRIEDAQKLIEDKFDAEQRAMKKAIEDEAALQEAAERLLKTLKDVDLLIESDTKETTDFAMDAWQEFFARFRIGWTQSSKHFKNEQAEMNNVINQIKENAFSTTQTLLNNTLNAEINSYNQRIANSRSYYDREIEMAGNNEVAKVELQKKRDKELAKLEKQKEEAATRAAKRKVYIDTAIAIARAFADYEYPYSLIVAALAGASAVAQIDQINKAPKGYAKGVIGIQGKGTETSDSIPAMLSKNESVMTAQETRDSYKTLHKIRAGKLNDKVLDKILMGNVTVVGSDDSRTAEKLEELIKITKANRPPDYVEKAGILYRVQTKGTNSKRYIRSKYGNFN